MKLQASLNFLMERYSICSENTTHPNPLPQGERGVMCDLLFVSPPLMGGDRGAGEIFSCSFVSQRLMGVCPENVILACPPEAGLSKI